MSQKEFNNILISKGSNEPGGTQGSQPDLFHEMQQVLREVRRENEDLRVSLTLNKESLKEMIKE